MVDDSLVAVYRQFDGVGCAADTHSLQLYEIPCSGADDDCDCNGFGDVEEECSTAALVVEDCLDGSNQTVTTYVTNLCTSGGEDTSQQVVCEGGDSLRTMVYENEQCDGYGFGINDGEFEVANDDDVCGFIVCNSSMESFALRLAVAVTFLHFLL